MAVIGNHMAAEGNRRWITINSYEPCLSRASQHSQEMSGTTDRAVTIYTIVPQIHPMDNLI
jgi:hypothetical protein